MSGVPKMTVLSREKGIALIEFAFVLPVLLLIIAGILYYGFAFVLVSSAQDAARSAAEAAIAVDPLTSNYEAVRKNAVETSADSSLEWLTDLGALVSTMSSVGTCDGGTDSSIAVTVTISPNAGKRALLPVFSIGGYQVPPGLDLNNEQPSIKASACAEL